jgi:hypothetical protein
MAEGYEKKLQSLKSNLTQVVEGKYQKKKKSKSC